MNEQSKPKKIQVTDSEPPALVRAQSAQWKQITIPLTEDQIKQLRALGASCAELKEINIRTFDINRLCAMPPN